MESLTRDEIETVRIHIGAAKERLMNQCRYNEAKEYEVIENKLLAMLETVPSAEPSYEAVMSYCKKRNLALIDCGELHDLEYEAWTQKPVVRCKDCAYCVIDASDGLPWCPEFYERTVEPDDYCSKAVRK